MSASCGGGGGTAVAPADYDRQIATDATLTEAQAYAAKLIDGPAVTENSNMTSIIQTAASGARSAAKGGAPVTETLPATIKYEYDTKLIALAITFPNGLPSKTGASCENEKGGGNSDHIIFNIYNKDGAIIRGIAKDGQVSLEKHTESEGADIDSDQTLSSPTVMGSYTIAGNIATIQFPDNADLFNGSLEDYTTMKLLNRSEKCVFGKYTINLTPAVETITTTTKPAPGASADSAYNVWYAPSKAFDGDYKSWWVGSTSATSWNLYYAFPAAQKMDKISVNYYGPTYVPATTTLWTSLDGFHWTKTATLPAGNSKPSVAVNKTVAYIWFQMAGTPAIGYPLIRDVDWMPIANNYGANAEPGSDDDWYFPSNAFDNNPNTWWVGKTGAPAWDIYYGYRQPTALNTITVNYYNEKYAPATTTLSISSDGVNWTTLASKPASPTVAFTVGATTQYIRVNMQGASVIGMPLVKDVLIN